MERLLVRRRLWLVIAGLVGLLVAGAVPGIDAALERLLQAVSTGVAVVALLLPVRSADELFPKVAEAARHTARRASQQMLADAGNRGFADIAFRGPSAVTEPELVMWRVAGCEGTTRQLPGILQAHRHHRLVVCGPDGAGKTGISNLLTEVLNGDLLDGEADPGFARRFKAVISFSLTGWTRSAEWLRHAELKDVADALDAWLAKQLAERHRIPWNVAHRRITDGSVLPVLDGLDQMDPQDHPDRPRAAAVVRAVNYRGGPVVLLCRTQEYQRVASGRAIRGELPVVQDALHVVLKDLTTEQVRDHLLRRFSDGSGGLQPRWQAVVDALRPGTDRYQLNLVRVLSRPWRLFLAVTAYRDPQTDPTEMASVAPERLDHHLMEQFIEVAATRYPRLGRYRRRRGGQGLAHYLSTLACYLRDVGNPEGRFRWSGTDLYLDTLWAIAGWYVPRYLSAAIKILMVAIPLGLVGILGARAGMVSFPQAALLFLVTSLAALLAFLGEKHPHPRPLERGDVRALDRRRRFLDHQLGGTEVGLIEGVLIAGGSGYLLGLLQDPGNAIAGGLVIGFVGGLVCGIVGRVGGVRSVSRPSSLLRKSIASELGFAFTPFFVMFVGVAIWLAVTAGLALGPALALVGAGIAAATGFGSLTFLTATRWLRFWIAIAIAAWRGDLPFRIAAFLDQVYEAGLVRLSGVAVQVRHQGFQEWLVVWREGEMSTQGHTVEAVAPVR